jgi:hypothetical protein
MGPRLDLFDRAEKARANPSTGKKIGSSNRYVFGVTDLFLSRKLKDIFFIQGLK